MGTAAFPSPQKPTYSTFLSNSNSTKNGKAKNKYVDVLSLNRYLFIFLFPYNK